MVGEVLPAVNRAGDSLDYVSVLLTLEVKESGAWTSRNDL